MITMIPYKGYKIEYKAGCFWATHRPYETLQKAKRRIDYIIKNKKP